MAKLHKVEFYLVDWDDEFDSGRIIIELENLFDPSGSIEMSVLKSKDIEEWDDDHKFNLISTPLEEYEKVFRE